MSKRKYGLVSGGGVFVDDETGLKVLPNKTVEIDKASAGAKTNQAILSGGLIEISEGSEKSSKKNTEDDSKTENKNKSDLPEDLPGRDVLIGLGISFEQIKAMTGEKILGLKGIGKVTAGEIEAYLKK